MYILELVTKLFKKKKITKDESVLFQAEALSDNIEDCEHVFLPLDSSNTMFACKYCGLIVPREKLKERNIFRNPPKT